MNWVAIATIADIIAAIAIVTTLIFLVFQIRQATTSRRAEIRQELANNRINVLEMNLRYPELRRARIKLTRGEDISEDEADALRWYSYTLIRVHENLVYQHDRGGMETEELEVARRLFDVINQIEPRFGVIIKKHVNQIASSFSDSMINEMSKAGLLDKEMT